MNERREEVCFLRISEHENREGTKSEEE